MVPSSPKCMLPLQIQEDNFMRRFVGGRPWRRFFGDSKWDKSGEGFNGRQIIKSRNLANTCKPRAAVELACFFFFFKKTHHFWNLHFQIAWKCTAQKANMEPKARGLKDGWSVSKAFLFSLFLLLEAYRSYRRVKS